jgi:hypothetical protein
MAEIGKFTPAFPVRPVDNTVQQPNDGAQQRPNNRPAQSQQNTTAQNTTSTAPINALPNDDALQRLIDRAQDAQSQGRNLQRGSIINLLV